MHAYRYKDAASADSDHAKIIALLTLKNAMTDQVLDDAAWHALYEAYIQVKGELL